MTIPKRTIPEADEDLAKWLNGNRIRIDSHEDAQPCTGQTESTPHRTRTCNPLIKSRSEIGLSETEKGDFGGRVCGSVGGSGDADRLIALAGLLASLSPEQIDALRRIPGTLS